MLLANTKEKNTIINNYTVAHELQLWALASDGILQIVDHSTCKGFGVVNDEVLYETDPNATIAETLAIMADILTDSGYSLELLTRYCNRLQALGWGSPSDKGYYYVGAFE